VRNELYGVLLFAGAVAVFIAFSFLALNYLPGPDWFWFLVSSTRSLVVRGFDAFLPWLPTTMEIKELDPIPPMTAEQA